MRPVALTLREPTDCRGPSIARERRAGAIDRGPRQEAAQRRGEEGEEDAIRRVARSKRDERETTVKNGMLARTPCPLS